MEKYAFLIGISAYRQVATLATPGKDIRALGSLLEKEFQYKVDYSINANLNELQNYFSTHIPTTLKNQPRDTQVLIYFAGHGVGENSEEGVKGFLIPVDGIAGDRQTWYPMHELLGAIDSLPNKHLLLVLDCCFGGAIRWASKFRAIGTIDRKLSKQHYNYFQKKASWQVLTSTAPDQFALDFVGRSGKSNLSPFAQCLITGLQGEADTHPDKVITSSELFAFLQQRLPVITGELGNAQNVGLYPLDRHENGEFLFCMDGFNPIDLAPIAFVNPYKGLNTFGRDDQDLFFGRKKAAAELHDRIISQPLTVVIGASGTGKSSLLQAGIVPGFPGIVKTIQPGRKPLSELKRVEDFDLLIIDQLEQLVTQSEEKEIPGFWASLISFWASGKKLAFTVRIDFEEQLEIPEELQADWESGHYLVPPFSAEELREIISIPALRVGRFFEPVSLVDDIIDEVIHYPGSLPLLSFTMQQLFDKCKDDPYRSISLEDYKQLKGVTGALQSSADEAYHRLSGEEKKTMRNLMLRMVSISGGETAGKRVLKSELNFGEAVENNRIDRVLALLEEKRLVQSGTDSEARSYYEPSHDALVRTWRRVQEWIKEFTAEYILLHSRLGNAVTDYERGQKDKKYLWHNNANLPLLMASPMAFNHRESSFIEKSKKLKRSNSLRLWSVVFAVIAGLSALTIYANDQRIEAQNKEKDAMNNLLQYQKAERDRMNERLVVLLSEAAAFDRAEVPEMELERYIRIEEALDSIQKLTQSIQKGSEDLDVFSLGIDTVRYHQKYKEAKLQ
ncbi:MAG: caspase family protein [Saprospiraceae bacterium]|nr:caspase family protein [Saprospiraceae bacterium]